MLKYIINTFKELFRMIKNSLVNNAILTISFVIFFILFPSIYYLYTFKLFNIVHDYPILSIFLTLFLFFSCLTIILVNLDKNIAASNINLEIMYKLAYNLFYIGALFVLFSLFFHISKFIVYHSTTTSIIVSFTLIILFLALKEANNSNSSNDDLNDIKDDLFSILNNILFLIPCYIVELINFVKSNVSGLPTASHIIMILISIIIVSFYVFPILRDLAKKIPKELHLFERQNRLKRRCCILHKKN